MKGVQNTNATDRGCLTKALSTKTLVVKHDDVNHMFYVQLDNGMGVNAVTYISAKNHIMMCCVQYSDLARDCAAAGIVCVYRRPIEIK
jgi:hypothetical protein